MRLITGHRQSGRTTRLCELAARYQRENPKHVCLLIAPTVARATWLSQEVMRTHILEWFDTGGELGLDPARTVIEHRGDFSHRNRGNTWANPDGEMRPHHVFAFVDDVNEYSQEEWDHLNNELTMLGVAVAGVVVEQS